MYRTSCMIYSMKIPCHTHENYSVLRLFSVAGYIVRSIYALRVRNNHSHSISPSGTILSSSILLLLYKVSSEIVQDWNDL